MPIAKDCDWKGCEAQGKQRIYGVHLCIPHERQHFARMSEHAAGAIAGMELLSRSLRPRAALALSSLAAALRQKADEKTLGAIVLIPRKDPQGPRPKGVPGGNDHELPDRDGEE